MKKENVGREKKEAANTRLYIQRKSTHEITMKIDDTTNFAQNVKDRRPCPEQRRTVGTRFVYKRNSMLLN